MKSVGSCSEWQPEQGFSAAVNLTDPELSASRKWHGSGLRLRNLDGQALRPILAVRNTSSESTQFRGRIPYTMPDGEVAFADIPETRIEANSTKIVRLNRIMDNANIPASIAYAGIELEYDSPPGSIVTSVQSVSEDGSHVFEVPMADPGNLPASAGGFPWKADGDFRTLVYIKNETDTAKRYTAHLTYQGGGYSLGVREIKPHQTVAIDFRELRDSQTPDAKGNIIPLNLATGQIAWSMRGTENKTLTGRSEQVSISGGVASTYACSNCCPNSTQNVWINPDAASVVLGAIATFTANETEINCFGQTFGPYEPWASWDSSNWNVASVGPDGFTTGVGIGFADISANWDIVIWFLWEDGYCEPWTTPSTQTAQVEVTDPQPTISEIGIVEKNGLKSVNISISGAGGQDTTIFRLRLISGSGIATFEDGSTQKSYTGNLAQTELKIKGVTESSVANNYVMEAVVNQTIDQSSARVFTVATITALAFERINTTGTGNVPDVALDDNPGTDGTHTAEEGQRIFPDKNWHQDTTDRATLRVRATLAPTNVPNLNVYFASFDLDDPSAAGLPIDTASENDMDNKGHVNNSKSGIFLTATGIVCTNAEAGTSPMYISKITCPVSGSTTAANLTVTMQPGDNFAVAASLDAAYRNEIHVNTSAGSNLINNANQVIPISGEANPNNVRGIRTKMLTVWRRLNIEVDSMGTVTGNNVIGMFGSSQTIAAGGNTNLTVIVNPALEVNRFENGRLVVTSVNPQRSFNVIDHTPTVTANTTNSVTVVNTDAPLNVTPGDTFILYDDDDFNDDDGVTLIGDQGGNIEGPDSSLLTSGDTLCPDIFTANNCNIFLNAYVRPVVGLAVSNEDVDFGVNVGDAEITALRNANFQNQSNHERDDFWAVYALGLYQYDVNSDGDPDGSGITWGIVDSLGGIGEGASVFLEVSRATEWNFMNATNAWANRPVGRRFTLAHELGHLFDGRHEDFTTGTTNAGLMAQTGIRSSPRFTDVTINKIRGGTGITNP